LVGDVNIHHKKWLKYSRENSTLGERLWGICRETGLKQCVRDPTRQKYLLDLVMSDVSEWLKVQVLPELSDHRVVSIDVDIAVSIAQEIHREVWDIAKAEWNNSKRSSLRLDGNHSWMMQALMVQCCVFATSSKRYAGGTSLENISPAARAVTRGWMTSALLPLLRNAKPLEPIGLRNSRENAQKHLPQLS